MKFHLTGEQIVALRDGESTDPGMAQHLEACELCRQEMESARSLSNLLMAALEPAESARASLSVDQPVVPSRSAADYQISARVTSPPGLPVESIHPSRSIGLLRVRQDANNTKFEYSPLEIDHSYLESPAQIFSASAQLHLEGVLFARREAGPGQVRPFTFNAGEFRFTVEAEDESGRHLRIHIRSRSDFPASPHAGLEVTLIDSENAPRIYTLDEQGWFHPELRSMRSILLLHDEPGAHLGIERSN